MAAWRWETFREIADPYHCQSIKRRHTWRPILLPHPYLDPQSPTPPSTTPLTPSSPPPPKSRPQTPPQAPGASRESPAVRDLASLTFARWQGARSHSGGGTLAAGLGRALPRTHLRGIPAWGRAHMPQQSPRFASSCKYICWICPTRDLLETFPPLRTAPVCPVKGAP